MNHKKFPELKLKSELRMPAEKVVELYELLEDRGLQIWVDGGWGVDALLEEQTREHTDLDIAIQTIDLVKLRELLGARGFKDAQQDDSRAWNFILRDDKGLQIDVHAISLDDAGNGIYGPPENGEMYPAAALTGDGVINGRHVRCISAEWVVKFHSGYKLKETDFHDIKTLCSKFGIELPREYIT